MILKIILFSVLLASGCTIPFQDFRTRLISLWTIIIYSTCCVAIVILFKGQMALISNIISTLVYFTFCFSVLFLFYFIKERKLVNIMDTKIGWGDALIFLPIGFTLETVQLIVFFTLSFCIVAVIGIFLSNKQKTIPLAGILVCFHILFLCYSEFLN